MDVLLVKFFEPERWEKALKKGGVKGIDPSTLMELSSPEGREKLLVDMLTGNFHIDMPHTAYIPKDDGTDREVMVNNGPSRIVASIFNDMLFELCGDMVHKSCTSYQTGIGCNKVVEEASRLITKGAKGFKSDLSKYFDTVPREFIHKAFDRVEERFGHSVLIDIMREYYNLDEYLDTRTGEVVTQYKSLKQGFAVASWLADVILYDMDEAMTKIAGKQLYVRYCDDVLCICSNYIEAMQTLDAMLAEKGLIKNAKKTEWLDDSKWFCFLGFSVKGKSISISKGRLKTFMDEVRERTVKKIKDGATYHDALHSVSSWMYRGDGEHSWAQGCLKTINVLKDLELMNSFVMDNLRAVLYGKRVRKEDIGGLGWVKTQSKGCVTRGKGRRVKTLRERTPKELPGYMTIRCMRDALLHGRAVYRTMVRTQVG